MCLENSQREEPAVAETKSTFVIVPGAGELAYFAGQLMVRRSLPYFTGHIYIYSDRVITHISPPFVPYICDSGYVCVWDRNNDSSYQRRPRWVVSFHQDWENRERGGALCYHLACHIHPSNIHSIPPVRPRPRSVHMLKTWFIPLLKMGH